MPDYRSPTDDGESGVLDIAQAVYAANKSRSTEHILTSASATFTVSDDIGHGFVTFEMSSPFLGVLGHGREHRSAFSGSI